MLSHQDASLNPLISGTRNLEDNISDLKAQLASNKKGVELLSQLVAEKGPDYILTFMHKIQENAKRNVQKALSELSLKLGLPPKGILHAREYMDDGSFVSLDLTIGNSIFIFYNLYRN
jgi:5-oxoprolinase (ATP-hydrolysing)